MAHELRTIQPLDYCKAFSDQNVRPDGRGLLEPRFTSINVGSISTAAGSALVRIGNSSVLCGIKAELAVPKVESPDEGFIIPNLELSPQCAAHFRPGPPCEQAQVINQQIVEIIESSKLIDLKQLCLKKGKVVWVLYCDIVCLNYDGSILDASLIALTAALKNLILPQVTVNPETFVPRVDLTVSTSVEIGCNPTSVTFCLFDDKLLIDPTYEEEYLSTSLVTISISEDGLCGVFKSGGAPMEEGQIHQCIDQAHGRRKNILELIKGAFTKPMPN